MGTHIAFGMLDRSFQAQQHGERIIRLGRRDKIQVVDLVPVRIEIALDGIAHCLPVGMLRQRVKQAPCRGGENQFAQRYGTMNLPGDGFQLRLSLYGFGRKAAQIRAASRARASAVRW